MHKILLTCPPMIGMVNEFEKDFSEASFDVTIPEFTQEMSEDALCEIIGEFDGWIIGDDPATRKVLTAGVNGKLKACVRWGVGTNNVDFSAFSDYHIPICNTPGVFGREVADLACHYVTALARETYQIDRLARLGKWHKPIGQSLWSATVLIVGYGDIGQNLAKRLLAHDMNVMFYDPYVTQTDAGHKVKKVTWPHSVSHSDYIVFTAPLTEETHHMLNEDVVKKLKPGVKIVNVARGPLIDETALVEGLREERIHSAALDVLEQEPMNITVHSDLLDLKDRLIFGSHNGSNTKEAVVEVSRICINKLKQYLDN